MAIWGRLTAAVSAIGIGGAASVVAAPILEVPRQKAWQTEPNRILEAETLALLVARGLITEEQGEAEALRSGFKAPRFKALVQLALEPPDIGELFKLWLRDEIKDPLLEHGLSKLQIEPQYWDALKLGAIARLSPEVLAEAIQRGIVPNVTDPVTGEPALPVGPPSAIGKVPPMPEVPVDVLAEAKSWGYDWTRLAALARLQGNPVGPQEAAHALFRDIIEEADFERAIAEGRTRNEWAFVYREVARAILSPAEAVNLRLRAWIDDAGMYARTARWGMSEADTDDMLLGHGRPISFHQVFIGLRRGGRYNVTPTDIDPAFLKSLQESDIRPEWYGLAWAQRHSLPAPFVIRALTEAGDFSGDDANTILLWLGWPEEYALKASSSWASSAGKGTGASAAVKSQRTAAITAIRKAYVAGGLAVAQAEAQLEAVAVSSSDASAMIAIWDVIYEVENGAAPGTGGPH